jgi:feruloyl esterase
VKVGKEITKTFYSKSHTKSYYFGCSTGGRQGFKAAQEFADDFDGIVVGAPALSFISLQAWSAHFYNITGPPGTPTHIPENIWPIVLQTIMNQCDEKDGAADGIIEDPATCSFDIGLILCQPESRKGSCLTSVQAQHVEGIFSPMIHDNKSLIYPALALGTPWSPLLNGKPFSLSEDWWRFVVYGNEAFDITKLTMNDVEFALKQNPSNIETWMGDLSAYKRRGGKLLHYHGQADPLISSFNSARYYEHVRATMKMSPEQLDEFYRYFPISGMGHCGGGAGAHMLGQSNRPLPHGLSVMNENEFTDSPDGNILSAIIRWVEKGIPPETLLGAKYVDDDQSKGVAFQRKHCRYPRKNHYQGPGNWTLPESWECVRS